MEALDALLTRVSHARLSDPAPSPEQLDRLFRVALRAPDHGQLRPWRFILVEGEGRRALGDLYARALASRQPDAAEEALAKARNMPLRAPLLVVAVACLQDHPKVPHAEQLLAAGCAAHGLVLGAYAQGLGAMWRTGEMATDPVVHAGLGLGEQERIIGFVYLGTPMGELRTPAELDPTAPGRAERQQQAYAPIRALGVPEQSSALPAGQSSGGFHGRRQPAPAFFRLAEDVQAQPAVACVQRRIQCDALPRAGLRGAAEQAVERLVQGRAPAFQRPGAAFRQVQVEARPAMPQLLGDLSQLDRQDQRLRFVAGRFRRRRDGLGERAFIEEQRSGKSHAGCSWGIVHLGAASFGRLAP